MVDGFGFNGFLGGRAMIPPSHWEWQRMRVAGVCVLLLLFWWAVGRVVEIVSGLVGGG